MYKPLFISLLCLTLTHNHTLSYSGSSAFPWDETVAAKVS